MIIHVTINEMVGMHWRWLKNWRNVIYSIYCVVVVTLGLYFLAFTRTNFHKTYKEKRSIDFFALKMK